MDLDFFSLIPFSFSTSKMVDLQGRCQIPLEGGAYSVLETVDLFVIGTLNNSVLDLEFFYCSEEITVEICDDYGDRLFFETIDTVETLHIIADLSHIDSWSYHVYIYNSMGVNISGEFQI